ncbi:MAG: hypothetical protein KF884_02240 [Fimbriimonadaceae bacterium]|nr:hypothetical protein [Fimbriimonadaceae bacterium]QYK58915.1 MAG: hypothetical protein KF884_02240 [Fimbriimonadaceae bacterium]
MSWRTGDTLGEQMVKEVHDVLRIDDAYLAERPDGFTYWAGDLATSVTTDYGVFRQGQCTYKLTATTDMVKGKGHLEELVSALEHSMDDCSFSGPVYDAPTDTFQLYAAVYASEDEGWLHKGFAAAVALQIAEAHSMAQAFGDRFHATRATSAHPSAGIRSHEDGSLTHAYGMFRHSGSQPSRWIGDPRWEACGWIMERSARSFETDRSTFLKAEFDWRLTNDGLMTLEVRTDEPHPTLGNGLHVTLVVPMRLSASAIGHLVIDLNTHEMDEYKRCHTLGSWCEHGGKLAHRLFVPNALYDPGVLESVCVTMTTRAIWTHEWFEEMKARAVR